MHYNWPNLSILVASSSDLLIKVPEASTTQCHTPPGAGTWTLIVHDNKLNAQPHTCSGSSPLDAQNPTQQECKMKNGHVQPPRTQSKNPAPKHPQPTQQWMKYSTTHPLQGVLSPTTKPCPKQAHIKPRAKTEHAQPPKGPAPKHLCSKIQCLFPLQNPTQGSRDKDQGETQTYTGTQKPSP
ncbi:hypothetical protein BS47DRAFT_1357472 [Hydnum rufescens UP504]|uniref:Uncharacterized protein n=1 Tax=Hydnum rufescens UP504 TaxID=1448309 RepID=A0A9P6BAY7_9AGAM|nr:hypothetical protein BS47DRAFT_1357472 [Hydnum rufescens UP504]